MNRTVTAIVVAAGLVACQSKSEGGATSEPKAKKVSKTAAGSTGTITGKIAFDGAAPEMPELTARFTEAGAPRDPACTTKEKAEHLIVTGGGVKDVVVRVAVGGAPRPASPPAPAVIDQHNCRYVPHVMAVVAGQQIAFKNSDATMHNIHMYNGTESVANVAQQKGAPENLTDVKTPPGDTPFIARCDVHPWMSTYVLVSDNPYFAVTGDDGSFKIADVPLGKYTIEAWHPHLGKKTVEVEVTPGAPIEAKLAAFTPADYKAPQ
jgi:plastocyanin